MGGWGSPKRGGIFQHFFAYSLPPCWGTNSWKFCRKRFVIGRDRAGFRKGGEGLSQRGEIFRKFFSLIFIPWLGNSLLKILSKSVCYNPRYRSMKFWKKWKNAWGAPLGRAYGFLAPKGDITCPRVQGAFPENLVEIGWYLLFFSFYGKCEKFAENVTFTP